VEMHFFAHGRTISGEWDRNDIFAKFISPSPPQLALSVEFLFEILYVGAPPIIEKCLLHGHFHSVNYYQYNIVEPKTLIYYVLGSIPSFND
ncbi:hypothetical protein, partial [Staphylococcus aureus]|uniref:hypothetical protein n=1 Tax=Staphylococcus aureus TaxID=1280 RepID=UPI0020440476